MVAAKARKIGLDGEGWGVVGAVERAARGGLEKTVFGFE